MYLSNFVINQLVEIRYVICRNCNLLWRYSTFSSLPSLFWNLESKWRHSVSVNILATGNYTRFIDRAAAPFCMS